MQMMRENLHQFMGRGLGTGSDDDNCRIIQCTAGTVMVIVVSCGGVDFVHAHCRKAMIDRWGVYCGDPFRRASNAALTSTWAEPIPRGLFIFRPIRLEIVPEQDWMQRTG